ncbi:phosphate ABC transporter permease PstA [Aureibacillus halotolerans]|uniref:Phosphate transport system permease protein PstA n=1 Tax=Aureibacillus halotolerans TaxID=1508390 RepID=A0A4R6UD44_9BACI|nr:phosphate ABC transporter permease PstA [Aureibacillus halotolerans]TDQ42989.1 phosphate ABC transporter membrane protein 2 (PhoT family) [Aureibacillus halotolerans]
MSLINKTDVEQRMHGRQRKNNVSKYLFLAATMFGLVVLAVLFYRVISQGAPHISWNFFTEFASRNPEDAGMKAPLYGTFWLMLITAPVSVILGVSTALYLEMYAKKNRFTSFIQTNISNLAGVPSIVFGLLGLTIFVRLMEMNQSIMAGGLTLALLILPVIIVASQESIRAVPSDVQEASYGLGATKWQTIRRVVLPAAIPGILTGSILALSRAIGETAPLIMIGAFTFIAFVPENVWSGFTAMPIQIYNWTARPQEEFQQIAAGGIIILLAMLLIMNSIAVLIRNKFSKRY